jgi:thiamine biosynthesis lipoprotein
MSESPKEIPMIRFEGRIPHNAYRYSHGSMATVFEIFVIHENPRYAEQAVREAFCELDRLEQELSRFIANSDISRINQLQKNQSTQIGLDAFSCLKQCAELTDQTNGAFDITVRKHSGLPLFELDETNFSVKLLSDSLQVDLGGFGKGYTVDQMAGLLTEWDIEIALIHGGQSSVLALAEPPGEEGWPVTLSYPDQEGKRISFIHLKHRALSGSGLQKGSHIIDPRTGKPVENRVAAWASTPAGAKSDALSTAFMVMDPEEIEEYCKRNPDTSGLVIPNDKEKSEIHNPILKFGEWDSLT